jgi:two-component system chemotaxis response regulator CheY
MKTLIVEDDFTSCLQLQRFLKSFGPSHIVVNGREAVEAVCDAMADEEPYDLICLDVMLPRRTGQDALRRIREREAGQGERPWPAAKIVVTTAMEAPRHVVEGVKRLCDGYLSKPIRKTQVLEELRKLQLVA